ncbi:MAG TPA: hypothetical protein VGK33_20970 [Chloroflexota bacterium]
MSRMGDEDAGAVIGMISQYVWREHDDDVRRIVDTILGQVLNTDDDEPIVVDRADCPAHPLGGRFEAVGGARSSATHEPKVPVELTAA